MTYSLYIFPVLCYTEVWTPTSLAYPDPNPDPVKDVHACSC